MKLLATAFLLIDAATVFALGLDNPIAVGARTVVIVFLSWVVLVLTLLLDTPRAIWPSVLWFQISDRLHRPKAGAVVFAGSSTIAHWASLAPDMAPLPVLNRGISGSRIHQISAYADPLVVAYRPRAVVFYAGENDIVGVFWSAKKSPEQVLAAYRGFCEGVHASLPEVAIYFISIKPQKRSPQSWPSIGRANELIRDYCASDRRLRFIDAVASMLDAQGKPRGDIFGPDGIHLKSGGV